MSKRLEDARKYGHEDFYHEMNKFFLEEVFKGDKEKYNIWQDIVEYLWVENRDHIIKDIEKHKKK